MGGGASKESEEKQRKLQNEVRELQQKQKQLEDEKRQQEQTLLDEQKRLEQLQAEQDKAKEKHEAAAAELKALAEQRDGLEEQVAAAKQETEQLKALLPASELPEDTKLAEIHELEEQSKELANMLDELEDQRNSNQAEKEKLEKELAEALGTEEEEAKKQEAGAEAEAEAAPQKSASGMQRVGSSSPGKTSQVKDLSQLRKIAREGPQEEEQAAESDPAEAAEAQPGPARQTFTADPESYAPGTEGSYGVEEPAAVEPMAGASEAPWRGASSSEPSARTQEVNRIRKRLVELESKDQQLEEKATTVRKRRQDVDSSLGRYAPDAPGRIKEAWQRGVTLGSLLDFFVENCGEVSFEPSFFGSDDDWRRPLCVATKLNRRCHQLNQENRAEISKKRLRPLLPNVFAVEKLFIRPLTEERRCSMAELWSSDAVDAEIFVSHAWTEDFGEFVQGLTRFAVSLTFRESPALPQDAAASHARGCKFFIHAFSDSMWSDDKGKSLEELPVYQTLASGSIKTVLLSTGLDGTSLLRAWCCVELFLAKEFQRTVVLNTRLGPMQDQSGPAALTTDIKQFAAMLVQAILPEMDVERAQATKDEDKSMLLRYLQQGGSPLQRFMHLRQSNSEAVCSQSLAILVQNGSAPLVKHALALRADPNSVDGVGIHPLTYAVAAAGEGGEVAQLLLSGKANPDAALGARHVLDLFSTDDQQRVQGVMELQKLGDAARRVHKGAIESARREYARRLVDTRWDELQSTSDEVRLSLLAAVGGIGHLAAPLAHDVAPLLGDPNLKIVEAASKVIAQFGSVEDYLNDPNPLTRAAVLKQVVRGRGREASAKYLHHFVAALKDEDFQVRHAGSQALLELGDLSAPHAAELAAALQDQDSYVRGNALQALGKIGQPAVPFVGNVAGCLGDSVPEVRRMAKEVLSKLRALDPLPAEAEPAAAE